MTRPNSARRESLKNQGRNNLVAGACNRIRLRIRNKSLSKAGRITDALFALQFVTSRLGLSVNVRLQLHSAAHRAGRWCTETHSLLAVEAIGLNDRSHHGMHPVRSNAEFAQIGNRKRCDFRVVGR
jgi:hypothetical protein